MATLLTIGACSIKAQADSKKAIVINNYTAITQPATDTVSSFVLNGTVRDENDEVLPGATVRIKGTSKGAQTNMYGKFIIEVEGGHDSLVVSFVGYTTRTIRINGRRNITINLAPDAEGQKLADVQVVGYGTQKKTSVVGSISTVSVKDIQKFSTPSLTNAIAGKLAGVVTRQTSGEPGYDAAKIFIRGQVSQSGVNKPLIIVDGAERELQDYWTTMNIQDIESFSILKDASATAVYGNRGANGVVLITTKKGAVGKPKVTFRTETAVVSPLRVVDYINGYEFAQLTNEALTNVGQPAKYTDAEVQKYKDGSDPYLYPNINWNDVVLRKHTRQSMTNLGISGGSEAVRYYVNLGYTVQQGIYNEDKKVPYETNAAVKRYNFRSNTDFQLSKSFSLALGLSGIISTANYPGRSAPDIFNALHFTTPNAYPIVNPNGSSPGGFGNIQLNPFAVITQTGYTKQFYNTLVNNLSAKWDLSSVVKGLSVTGLAAYDLVDITQNVRQRTPALYNYTKNSAGEDTYTIVSTETPLGFYLLNENYKTVYLQTAVNYNRTFGKHSVTGLLAAERREFTNVNTTNSVTNLPERRQGLISRLTYNYDSRYLLELNAGYNGSENFPKGKQYGFFPSIGAGWLVSNEKFWNKDVISSLKLRGSYGLVGNDRIGGDRFIFLSTYNKDAAGYVFGINQNINPGGKSEARIGNDNVTWERAYKSNAGIDLELFNGAFTLTADVFRERREGQLLARASVPIYAGYPGGTLPYANVGITTNKGFDGSFQIRNTSKGGFYYSVTGNFTFAKNVIVENDAAPALYPWQELRGHPIGANLGYVGIGFFKDQQDVDNSPNQTALQSIIRPGDIKYKDINNDGKIDNADRTVIGNYGSEPRMIFGLGTTLAWKGFDVSVFLQGAAQRDFFFSSGNQAYTAWAFSGGVGVNNVMQQVYDNRWVQGADNSNAQFPAVRALSTNNYIGSTVWQRKGDYLRIKNAEIGYTLPARLSKKLAVRSVRFFAQGTNLATWDYIKSIDPESDFGTGGYPITRNFNFGLDLNF
ncbi:SusC/RagA family TonB-linked outer membrane protein [Mucilaginibacter pocheonensis]|uniref:TonB-linked SusC/RagA family outer membrane protein n=1 Tax=Mucilaginibacter pocheonensis TaxID=398050 RepID=A0ABU1T865_9SPHI|nr:TonB-dependent receptor [Mucilaginibacter pocheonensis]MDR6940995.1 TonB-linked SusC/RagA family outer membrane protein [Mucilaginibacter pocheonensis]